VVELIVDQINQDLVTVSYKFIYKDEKMILDAKLDLRSMILPASEKSLVKFLAGLENGMPSIHSTSSFSICAVSPIIFLSSYRSNRVNSYSDQFIRHVLMYRADNQRGNSGSCCHPVSLVTQSRIARRNDAIHQQPIAQYSFILN